MDPNKISYTDPVSRSFDSVKRVLFKPFDIGKWFALGFSAWLATLMSGGSNINFQGNFNGGGGSTQEGGGDEFEEFIHGVTTWIQDHMVLVIALAAVGVLIALAFYVVILWVSSRGKFMFLDNLVHDRALVKTPWKNFKTLGNSLFVWRLVFGLIVFLLLLLMIGVGGAIAYGISEGVASKAPVVLAIIAGALATVAGALVIGYITVMLENFVVPIMYREGLRTNAAWKRFLSLHRAHFWKFLLYFLWFALLSIGAGMALMIFGFMTCCIGLLLMAIPYIGAVLILPVTSFFRFLGPEFLRQFGQEYDIFPGPPVPPHSFDSSDSPDSPTTQPQA